MFVTIDLLAWAFQAVQERASFRPSLRPAATPVTRRAVRRAAVCSSEQTESPKVGQIVSAAALAVALSFGTVQAAHADISGLTPCSESKGFAKRQKQEVKALTKRLAKVSSRSAYLHAYPVPRLPAFTLTDSASVAV